MAVRWRSEERLGIGCTYRSPSSHRRAVSSVWPGDFVIGNTPHHQRNMAGQSWGLRITGERSALGSAALNCSRLRSTAISNTLVTSSLVSRAAASLASPMASNGLTTE